MVTVNTNNLDIIFNNMCVTDMQGNVISCPTDVDKWKYIRDVRDKLLSDTDWVVVKAQEEGTSIPKKYKKYRKYLREIPQKFQSPVDVIFPSIDEI